MSADSSDLTSWVWTDRHGVLSSYNGASNMMVADSGAVVFFNKNSDLDLVLAPGDWHDLARTDGD